MTHLTDAQLQEYADDELPLGPRAQLARHVDGCPRCQARIARLAELRARLREIVDEESALESDILPRIGLPSGGLRRGLRLSLRAAAAVLLFGLGYGVGAWRAAPEASPASAGPSGEAAEVQRLGSMYVAAIAAADDPIALEVAASTLSGATVEFRRLTSGGPEVSPLVRF